MSTYRATGSGSADTIAVGERVTILVGPHRGQVAPIYAIWAERGQVRVDLGVEKQITVKDVYAYFQICRPNT